MQCERDAIYQWANANNATFNSDKCECIHYHYRRKLAEQTKYVADGGNEIECEQHLKYLSVTVSDNGTFNQHIQNIVLKVRQQAGWIFRTFHTRAKFLMMILCEQLVRSFLDYFSQLWSLCTQGLINQTESVQKSYVRNITGLCRLD